jgi:hypothetical protein
LITILSPLYSLPIDDFGIPPSFIQFAMHAIGPACMNAMLAPARQRVECRSRASKAPPREMSHCGKVSSGPNWCRARAGVPEFLRVAFLARTVETVVPWGVSLLMKVTIACSLCVRRLALVSSDDMSKLFLKVRQSLAHAFEFNCTMLSLFRSM